LHQAIRQVLARAVERGGSTLRDFSNAHGDSGEFPAGSDGVWPGRPALPGVRKPGPVDSPRAAVDLFLPHLSENLTTKTRRMLY
jgi:hypothetical protein